MKLRKYPNLEITIIGEPGLGKTQVAHTVKKYLESLNNTNLSVVEVQEGKRRKPSQIIDVLIRTTTRKSK